MRMPSWQEYNEHMTALSEDTWLTAKRVIEPRKLHCFMPCHELLDLDRTNYYAFYEISLHVGMEWPLLTDSILSSKHRQ